MKKDVLFSETKNLIMRNRLCIVGFSFCLAWLYTAFFSCALVPLDYALFSSDTFWSVATLAEALMAFVMLIGLRNRALSNSVLIAATVVAAIGTFIIRFGFFDAEHYVLFYSVGAFVAGLGFAVLLMGWNILFGKMNEEEVEIIAPAAFALSFIVYFAMFALKGSVAVYPIALMPLVSALLLVKQRTARGHEEKNSCEKVALLRDLPKEVKRDGFALLILFFVVWFNFGFFRIFAAPDFISDRTLYYFVPFSIALVATFFILVLSIKHVHVLNISSAFRWVFALACLGYAVVYISPHNDTLRLIGYAIDFTGMFTVQICTFIVLPKMARNMGLATPQIFAPLLLAEGLGVFSGIWAAKEVYVLSQGSISPAWCFFVLTLLVAVGMFVGLRPEKYVLRTTPRGASREETSAETRTSSDDAVAALAQQCSFSARETEIGKLLLAGYNRSRIRDELFISLNTVNAHVKSIYAKSEVHSLQELFLLVRQFEHSDEICEELSDEEPVNSPT